MTGDDTAGYRIHHFKIAGLDNPFSADATTVIQNSARGYPGR